MAIVAFIADRQAVPATVVALFVPEPSEPACNDLLRIGTQSQLSRTTNDFTSGMSGQQAVLWRSGHFPRRSPRISVVPLAERSPDRESRERLGWLVVGALWYPRLSWAVAKILFVRREGA